jgi:hypothetical protein
MLLMVTLFNFWLVMVATSEADLHTPNTSTT